MRIEPNGVDLSPDGTEDVGLRIVSNHYGAGVRHSALPECIFENDRRRFIGSCLLRAYDFTEIGSQSAVAELDVLGLDESVGQNCFYEVTNKVFRSCFVIGDQYGSRAIF